MVEQTERPAAGRASHQEGSAAFVVVLFLLGCLLRAPALPLPVSGDDAQLATWGAWLGEERGWGAPEGPRQGPLLPVLLAVPVAAGAPATPAIRWLDLLLGAAIAPLAFVLARRLGTARDPAIWTGLLVALHPALVAFAGGVATGSAALVCVLLLASLRLLLAVSPRSRRGGLFLGALLPLADPLAAVYVPGLTAVFAHREPALRMRIGGGVLALVCFLLAPWPAVDAAIGFGHRLLGLIVLWAPAAALVLLCPNVPRGLWALWRAEPDRRWPARIWIIGAALHIAALLVLPLANGFRWGTGVFSVGLALLPLVLLAGVRGVKQPSSWRRPRVALLVALPIAVFLVSGPFQAWLSDTDPPRAGRLHLLKRATDRAVEIAGPEGWVGLDLGAGQGWTAERLRDRMPGVRAGTIGGRVAGEPETVGGGALPLEELPAGARLAVVTPRREIEEVSTYGGRGIYLQEIVETLGPWMVLSVRRP
ncbi:MAG: hypothetical protein ACYTG6_06900 [Planctomycetota bacterium]|jgi:hypothetical protein